MKQVDVGALLRERVQFVRVEVRAPRFSGRVTPEMIGLDAAGARSVKAVMSSLGTLVTLPPERVGVFVAIGTRARRIVEAASIPSPFALGSCVPAGSLSRVEAQVGKLAEEFEAEKAALAGELETIRDDALKAYREAAEAIAVRSNGHGDSVRRAFDAAFHVRFPTRTEILEKFELRLEVVTGIDSVIDFPALETETASRNAEARARLDGVNLLREQMRTAILDWVAAAAAKSRTLVVERLETAVAAIKAGAKLPRAYWGRVELACGEAEMVNIFGDRKLQDVVDELRRAATQACGVAERDGKDELEKRATASFAELSRAMPRFDPSDFRLLEMDEPSGLGAVAAERSREIADKFASLIYEAADEARTVEERRQAQAAAKVEAARLSVVTAGGTEAEADAQADVSARCQGLLYELGE